MAIPAMAMAAARADVNVNDNASTIMDVIVIGGGISGLSAANYLLNHNSDLKVRVLEARSRVGGRTWTKLGDDGHPIDVGGVSCITNQSINQPVCTIHLS